MAPKWFSQSDDSSNQHSDTMAFATSDPTPKKASRLSATFGTDSRPWNFMSSSSDRSSSSSRKRLSLFGARNSIASSADIFSSGHSSPRDSAFVQPGRSEISLRPESRFSIDSKSTTIAVPPAENWRSSIFSLRRSSKASKGSDSKDETLMRWLRSDSRTPSWRRESTDCDREHESDETFYQTLRRKNISAPFNFQHVTHTQQEQLPQLASVTDSELVSEFWAASAFQAPRSELRGIKADPVDSSYRVRAVERRPSTASSVHSESFALRQRGLSFTSSVHELDSTPRTPRDAESPVDERARSLSLSSRTHSFSSRLDLPSRERLAALGAEQREPPTMIHPALRTPPPPTFERTSSQPQIFELPGTSLESVPEEMEGCGPSPAKLPRAKAMLDLSPLASPKLSPRSSPSLNSTARQKNSLVFTPFPVGNAFAQAHGGSGAEVPRTSSESRLSFSVDGNVPSLTSGESWENDIDFCYLVEAESSCDFDWESVRSSRKGSASSARRDSTTSVSVQRASYSDPSRRASIKSQPDVEALFADFDGSSNFVKEQTRHDSPQMSVSRADLSPILESPAKVPIPDSSSETVSLTKPSHNRSISLDDNVTRGRSLDRSARWSIASPLCLPEDARQRGITFTHPVYKSRAIRMSVPASFAAPPLPPPKTALPPLPAQQPAKPVSPPVSPTSTWPSSFPTMRRPSSAQDRAILQAAGRFVRNGRASSRPTTPSRLSHVQHAMRTSSSTAVDSPTTPPKTTASTDCKYGGVVLPTPPMSPPEQHQGFQEYPAWI
ncbi:hypothetical protein E4T48_00451 [Aureobasidium sp. EXF-10727]|nr:hypothetical protein E4T48_00451 [Aureobasidium sp. EXF-10727]KAI4729697.1 hypothetical protein E4T49_02504 [Aureobasidium sp. EXF-10728]